MLCFGELSLFSETPNAGGNGFPGERGNFDLKEKKIIKIICGEEIFCTKGILWSTHTQKSAFTMHFNHAFIYNITYRFFFHK